MFLLFDPSFHASYNIVKPVALPLFHEPFHNPHISLTKDIDPPQIQGSEVVRSKVHVSGKTRTPKFTAAKAKVVRDKPVMT